MKHEVQSDVSVIHVAERTGHGADDLEADRLP
jgi:hypothetical protein